MLFNTAEGGSNAHKINCLGVATLTRQCQTLCSSTSNKADRVDFNLSAAHPFRAGRVGACTRRQAFNRYSVPKRVNGRLLKAFGREVWQRIIHRYCLTWISTLTCFKSERNFIIPQRFYWSMPRRGYPGMAGGAFCNHLVLSNRQ